jgi:hypothetical protein
MLRTIPRADQEQRKIRHDRVALCQQSSSRRGDHRAGSAPLQGKQELIGNLEAIPGLLRDGLELNILLPAVDFHPPAAWAYGQPAERISCPFCVRFTG